VVERAQATQEGHQPWPAVPPEDASLSQDPPKIMSVSNHSRRCDSSPHPPLLSPAPWLETSYREMRRLCQVGTLLHALLPTSRSVRLRPTEDGKAWLEVGQLPRISWKSPLGVLHTQTPAALRMSCPQSPGQYVLVCLTVSHRRVTLLGELPPPCLPTLTFRGVLVPPNLEVPHPLFSAVSIEGIQQNII